MNAKPLAPAANRDPDHDDFHPLEVVPYFRRFRKTRLRDLVYTFIWSCGIGVIFWAVAAVFRPQGATPMNLVWTVIIANCIGYTIHGLFVVGHKAGVERWARAGSQWLSVVYYTGVSTLGVIGGFAIFALAVDTSALRWLLQPRWIAMMGFSSFLISVILASVFFARARQARTDAELQRERLRAERVEREAALANLRALQAQIEPHFLFNTLANVASLVDPDPGKAKAMLESFIQFLRASLAATRMEATTLGAEAELVAAYLRVLQVRMGNRLRYRIDVADDLRAMAIAPMLLQPVVENAIRHGLEPKVAGGEVALRAWREGDDAVIEISDTGVGFAAMTRGGVGLTNLRARLALLYGERSRLTIAENSPSGAIVALRFPA